MKILVDENIDQSFADFMPDHDVFHVTQMGWSGVLNGALLTLASEAGFKIFITADKNMPYQQSMRGKKLSLFVLDIHPNTIATQVACLPQIRNQMSDVVMGKVYTVSGPHSKRRT